MRNEFNEFQNSNFEIGAPFKQLAENLSKGNTVIPKKPRSWKWVSKTNHNGSTTMGHGSELLMNNNGSAG